MRNTSPEAAIAAMAAARTVEENLSRPVAAAEKLGVTVASLQRARRILKFGTTELIDLVSSGDATLYWGDTVCRKPPNEQLAAIKKLHDGLRPGVAAGRTPLNRLANSPLSPHRHAFITDRHVTAAAAHGDALRSVLQSAVLDPDISPEDAGRMLHDLRFSVGAYQSLRSLLKQRKEST